MTLLPTTLAILLGVTTWTLLEYLLHRWLGHERQFRGNLFGLEHQRHHFEGDYFAPAHKKIPVAAAAGVLLSLPAIRLVGVPLGLGYVGGLLAAYAVYELLHRRYHTHAGFGPYGRWARRHHFHHHFVDARSNHGVTSPLWDLVFGTYVRPTTIRVPARLCMPWLLDPRTGAIAAEHAGTFVLKTSPTDSRSAPDA